ncbi:terminase endonuclease subunit [Erwinia mallotivora]|uniref:phage terminase small subunit n=1 Tax=Erwinia mallotivora TaxID=69222 RepID=UPI0021C22A10|nr:terminase endonuclease subunit [Erwinia mallotivora]
MLSPARRHLMRMEAMEASQQAGNPLRHANGYELMLLKLNDDKRRLKKVRSQERKAELKRQLLPEYGPWVAGVLASGKGAQDAVLMTVMIWRLDAGDVPGALEVARYALTHGLVPPPGFKRDATAYLLAEEVADAATRARTLNEPVDTGPLLATLEMTKSADMPDQVRAKLHKITGYVLRDAGRASDAMEHLTRALQLHDGCGVKKDIERLAGELKKQALARR